MGNLSQPHPQRVLYVVSRFPSLSTTFTTNEMAAVAARGVSVYIAPIWKTPANQPPHASEEALLSRVVRPTWRHPRTWRRVLKAATRPQAWGVIARLVPGHLTSAYLPLKLLSAIPRGLFWGQWCVDNHIDHIHAHFLTSPATVALIASAVSGVPYSYTAHAHDITARRPPITSGSVELKARRAALGVTISHYNRRYMLQRWPRLANTRLEVIYNGIDTGLFRPHTARAHDPQADKRVISVSRLVPIKGHEFLIRAVAQLRREGVGLRLDMYGEGPQRRALQKLIDELDAHAYIRLCGAIVQEALAEELRAADVFALASVLLPKGDCDGLPAVLAEALACGLPTVSTQVTGIPEIIQDGVTGLCVPPGDVSAMAEAIRWVLDHPAEAAAMARRGRQLVEEQFDRHKSAQKLLACWREIHVQG